MSFSRAKRSFNRLSHSNNQPLSNKIEKQSSNVSAGVHKLARFEELQKNVNNMLAQLDRSIDRAWCDMVNVQNHASSKVKCSYNSPLLTNCSGLKAGELLEVSTVFAKQSYTTSFSK